MVEMCKGVQHPTRGLFLRNYLSEMTKDKLPDVGTPYYGEGGDIHECIDFTLQNFVEMNKLWVRMQHQTVGVAPAQLEKERSDIKLLVGTNLSRLSQLEGVDCDLYTTTVLPRVVDQIVICKDRIAQQYLMECIIQVFPDEWHLNTLDIILKTCGELQEGVNVKSILVSLIDRLTNYVATPDNSHILSETDVFAVFYKNFASIIKEREDLSVEDVMQSLTALLNFTMECYPGKLENVDSLLVFCGEALDGFRTRGVDIATSSASKQIVLFLNQPLKGIKNILDVLTLEHYPTVMQFLSYATRKRVSVDIAKSALKKKTVVQSADDVNRLFEFIAPIIKDQDDQPLVADLDMEDFEEEQQLVGSLVHLFVNDDLREQAAMYVTARKHFASPGPTLSMRIAYTLPPLIFASLKLATNLKDQEEACKKVFKFVHETVSGLNKAECPELSLKLFINAALAASNCRLDVIAYEFVTQCFVVYEDSISDSKQQAACLQLIMGSIYQMDCFDKENYETLITKTAQHASRLLVKPAQCTAIYTVSHLFWTPSYKDGKRVLECLQKALKIADTCMETEINLFIEILKKYLYYFLKGNDAITVKYLSGLIALINTNMDNKEVDLHSTVHSHYKNTLDYIRYLKQSPEHAEQFAEVDV